MKPEPRMGQPRLVILAVLARPLYALILLASVWVLLRGMSFKI